MILVRIVLCAIIAYLMGGLNPAYVIGKLRGFDIRSRGSGNAGASNALITMGKKEGAICALFDIFKAYVCVKSSAMLFPDTVYASVLLGSACALGHIFPASMGFRGGKGLACLGGMVLAFDRRVFVIMLVSAIAVVLVTDYLCVVPMAASVAFVPVCAAMTKSPAATVITAILAAVIIIKHVPNIKRIRSGTEAHFSFLWRRDEEICRLRENGENEE